MKTRLLRTKSRKEIFVTVIGITFVFAMAGIHIALSAAVPTQTDATHDSVIYLDQGWSQADRATYYQISQGSAAISFDIFLNLEVADSQDLFRSDANSDRYGLTPQAANPQTNPDALPIGLSKTVITEGRWKGVSVGLNCAACHNTQLTYQGKQIRIDGGVANNFDLMAYIYALDDALQATLTDSAKFDRLAARLGASNPEARGELRKRFESEAAIVHVYRTRTWSLLHLGGLLAWTPSL
jgi:hypothetical protein